MDNVPPGATEFVMLKAELAEAHRMKDELQSELNVLLTAAPLASAPYYFLKKLPIEIRNEIYGMLIFLIRMSRESWAHSNVPFHKD